MPCLEKPARKKRRLSPEEAQALEPLPVAEDAVENAALTKEEMKRLKQCEERTLNELRIFLREVLGRLIRDRRFSIFCRPIDPDAVPDYFEIIKVCYYSSVFLLAFCKRIWVIWFIKTVFFFQFKITKK